MRRVGIAIVLGLLGVGSAAAQTLGGALAEPIRRARAQTGDFALHIVHLKTGVEVASVDADRPLVIASNTKLFTTAAALDLLGPGFFFETPLLMRGTVRGDALDGDLAVLGSGDPTFSGRHHGGDPLAVFRGWARRLRELGIRRVDGDVLLYHAAYDDDRIHPDWPEDQLSRCYEAPVDALSFNDNCLRVTVRPGSAPGRPARVEIFPRLDLVTLRNEATTTSSSRRHRIGVDRVEGTDEIVVSGSVYHRARPLEASVTIDDPTAFFGAGLAAALAEEGVSLEGRLLPVTALPGGPWWRFLIHRSDLLTTLRVINTDSQNFHAESVLKALGREGCGEGSWKTGRQLISDFVSGLGIAPESFQLADGSGMSRDNRFAARHLTALLRHMGEHELAAEFAATLPSSGLEDHPRWRNRLAREPYRGRVLAKTGTLSGISTLSGYARAVSGRSYVFAILANDVRSVYDARRAQDRILRALIDHG